MNNLVWKSFKMYNLLKRSTDLAIKINQKDLNISEESTETNTIALISASRVGSGRVGYINKDLIDNNKISINKITFDDQWGFTYFQQEPFVITGGHNAILEITNNNFKNILDNNLECYAFLSKIINQITIRSGIFSYGYKINNKFDREIILLPCLEVSENDDYIWEENGHYYTLAVEYIKDLMKKAKILKEEKTICFYEAEKAKYEAEKAKYEAGYLREKKRVTWRGVILDSLMQLNSKHVIDEQIKNVHVYPTYENGTVAIVTASKENNGIVGYIEENDEINSKKRKGVLTIAPDAAYAGICFYQEDYVVSTGHNKLIDIINLKFKHILDTNPTLYYFLSKILTKTFCKTFYGFSKSITNNDFHKTIILLPCLEVSENDDYIWEENGHYYTLAIEYISYLYLQGKVNYYQKLINNYTYQY